MPAPAANALLKTLEEPPGYGLIILQSQSDNLLPTIVSRCQRVTLWESGRLEQEQWDFDKVVSQPFYEQSALAAKIAESQQSLIFLAAMERWARSRLRHKKDQESAVLIKELVRAKREIRGGLIPRIVLETLILRYTNHV